MDNHVHKRIYDVLKGGCFQDPQDLVDISPGPDDSIYVVIVSRKFDGKRLKEKTDLIWNELFHLPPEVWQRITLSVGVSLEEILHGV